MTTYLPLHFCLKIRWDLNKPQNYRNFCYIKSSWKYASQYVDHFWPWWLYSFQKELFLQNLIHIDTDICFLFSFVTFILLNFFCHINYDQDTSDIKNGDNSSIKILIFPFQNNQIIFLIGIFMPLKYNHLLWLADNFYTMKFSVIKLFIMT